MFSRSGYLQYIVGALALCTSTVAVADTAYITHDSATGPAPSTASVIKSDSNTAIKAITPGGQPRTIVVNPQTRMVYAANKRSPFVGGNAGDVRRPYAADKVVHMGNTAGNNLLTDVPAVNVPISIGTFTLPGCAVRHRLDFNGNGTTDFSVFRQPTGQWFNLQSFNVVFGVPNEHDIPVAEDYDGDCKADNAYWNPTSGTWNVILSSTGATVSQQWGAASLGDIPSPGDYDGDGKSDFAVFRQSTGQWFIIESASGVNNTVFGVAGEQDVPVPGDYDGDGKTDLAYWAPSTGTWNVRFSSNGTTTTRAWGLGSVGDVPVPGDYDGDGKTDFAVFRQPTGQWFIIESATGAINNLVFGVAGQVDIPVPGDYDGDGKTDTAYWDPVSGTWNVRLANGTTTNQQWGSSAVGDIPLPAPPAYIRSHF